MSPKIAIFRGFVNFFQNYWIATQVRLFILIESPNIFHSKSETKANWVWFYGHNLGQIRFNNVKKTKKLALSIGFYICCKRNAFKSKK